MPTELESWLDQLGLGQYAAAFVAHAIDLDIVADLTDADWSVSAWPRSAIASAC